MIASRENRNDLFTAPPTLPTLRFIRGKTKKETTLPTHARFLCNPELPLDQAKSTHRREAAMCTVSMVFLLEERVTSMTRAGKWWMRRVHAYVWGGHRALPPGL
ncbi:hypothetical protein VPH35_124609 [Triticum aestivum]